MAQQAKAFAIQARRPKSESLELGITTSPLTPMLGDKDRQILELVGKPILPKYTVSGSVRDCLKNQEGQQ